MNKDTSITQGDVFLSDNEVGGDDFEDGGCLVIDDKTGECWPELPKACMQTGSGILHLRIKISRNLNALTIFVRWSGDVTIEQKCTNKHKDSFKVALFPGTTTSSGWTGVVIESYIDLLSVKDCGPCKSEKDCPAQVSQRRMRGRYSFILFLTDELKAILKRIENGEKVTVDDLVNPVTLDDGESPEEYMRRRLKNLDEEPPISPAVMDIVMRLWKARNGVMAAMKEDLRLCT